MTITVNAGGEEVVGQRQGPWQQESIKENVLMGRL